MYKQGLYHDWVPKLLQLLLIIVTAIPFMAFSGVYSTNIVDMASGMNELSENYTMATYAMFIGMTAGMLLLFRTKQYFRSKEVVVVGLLAIAVLSYVCATTDSGAVIVFASLLLGFLKMFGMIEFILPIFYIISPKMDRNKCYPIFYPMALIIGQYAGYYMSAITYQMFWEYSYLFAIIYSLVCALCALIFMHSYHAMKPIPIYQFHGLSVILFFVAMMVLNYLLVFTKYHGWLRSEVTWGCGVAFVVLTGLFLYIQTTIKRPFLSLAGFSNRNVIASFIMILLMGLFVASGGMLNTYMMGVLGYTSFTVNQINTAMLLGAVVGGVVSFIWLKKQLPIKGLVFAGFGSYVLAHLILYFTIAPVVEIESFVLPTVLRGTGMCLLYISVAIYASEGLVPIRMLSVMSILVMIRSFIGPAFFGTILTWALYKLQLQNLSDLAAGMDSSSVEVALRGGARLYGATQLQAIMLAVKQLLGYTIVGGFVVLLYVSLHRFGTGRYRRFVQIRSKIKRLNRKNVVAQNKRVEAQPELVS